MGKRWATVATTTYADGSPADDGSVTTANQVKYATIKTDLTDPLDTAIDSIVANLDGLFADGAVAISSAYPTTATDHAKVLEVTGTTTITLIAAATGGAGYRVGVKNAGSGVVTVDGNGAETIDGVASVTVPVGDTSMFLVNAAGTGWIELKSGNLGKITGFHVAATTDGTSDAASQWTDMTTAAGAAEFWLSETYDFGSNFAAPSFTAPATGEYLFTWQLVSETSMADQSLLQTRLLKNGTTEIGRNINRISTATTANGLSSGAALVRLAATDTVKVQYFHTHTANVVLDGNASVGASFFSGVRIS